MHTTTQRISDIRGRFSVAAAAGRAWRAATAVIATGQATKPDPLAALLPAGTPRYVRKPWSAQDLGRIATDDRVLVLGTGRAAVDVVVAFEHQWHRGLIRLVSRSALLPQRLATFQMRVGDCFDDGTVFAEDNNEVDSVPGVPCSKPHDNEVYAVFDVGVASFPGEAMADLANEACMERFEPFVGRDYESSSLDIATLYPSHDSWHREHDREVICAVYDVDTKKLTGSVQGLAL